MRAAILICLAILLGPGATAAWAQRKNQDLAGQIEISTPAAFPGLRVMAGEFKELHPKVKFRTHFGDFDNSASIKNFARNESAILEATRRLNDQELAACRKTGIEPIAFHLGWEAVAVFVHPQNAWVRTLTLEQLKRTWHPGSKDRPPPKTWKEIDPAWPAKPLALFAPGACDASLYHFNERVNGKENVTRNDVTYSQADDSIRYAVARNPYALGYVGNYPFEGAGGQVQLVSLAAKAGGPFFEPTPKNVHEEKYPLSRRLYLYTSKRAFERAEVRAFIDFCLKRQDLMAEAGLVKLSKDDQKEQQATFRRLEEGLPRPPKALPDEVKPDGSFRPRFFPGVVPQLKYQPTGTLWDLRNGQCEVQHGGRTSRWCDTKSLR